MLANLVPKSKSCISAYEQAVKDLRVRRELAGHDIRKTRLAFASRGLRDAERPTSGGLII
jgi:hypothetical protein